MHVNPAYGLEDETDNDGAATLEPHRRQVFTITASSTANKGNPTVVGQNGHCVLSSFRNTGSRSSSARSRMRHGRSDVDQTGNGRGRTAQSHRRDSCTGRADPENSGGLLLDAGGDVVGGGGQNISDVIIENGLICVKL